jgi:hypothetical protein
MWIPNILRKDYVWNCITDWILIYTRWTNYQPPFIKPSRTDARNLICLIHGDILGREAEHLGNEAVH